MDIERLLKKNLKKKYNVSLNPSVVEPLKERLKESGVSFSGYVNAILEESWEMMKDLPVKAEDLTVKQYADILGSFTKKMKE